MRAGILRPKDGVVATRDRRSKRQRLANAPAADFRDDRKYRAPSRSTEDRRLPVHLPATMLESLNAVYDSYYAVKITVTNSLVFVSQNG